MIHLTKRELEILIDHLRNHPCPWAQLPQKREAEKLLKRLEKTTIITSHDR